MKVVVQRVLSASVKVNENLIGKINKGYMILVGFTHSDNSSSIKEMINKIINLRIMDDENGIMNKSILDTQGSILSISQFTLYADTKKGNRPSYTNALESCEASKLYDEFNKELKKYVHVEAGKFGSEMMISLINDGPVTIILER